MAKFEWTLPKSLALQNGHNLRNSRTCSPSSAFATSIVVSSRITPTSHDPCLPCPKRTYPSFGRPTKNLPFALLSTPSPLPPLSSFRIPNFPSTSFFFFFFKSDFYSAGRSNEVQGGHILPTGPAYHACLHPVECTNNVSCHVLQLVQRCASSALMSDLAHIGGRGA